MSASNTAAFMTSGPHDVIVMWRGTTTRISMDVGPGARIGRKGQRGVIMYVYRYRALRCNVHPECFDVCIILLEFWCGMAARVLRISYTVYICVCHMPERHWSAASDNESSCSMVGRQRFNDRRYTVHGQAPRTPCRGVAAVASCEPCMMGQCGDVSTLQRRCSLPLKCQKTRTACA